MPTNVELLIHSDPSILSDRVANLTEYFQTPDRHAVLRLAVLGLVPHLPNSDEMQWRVATDSLKELFKDIVGIVDFNEHTIRRFALSTRRTSIANLEGYLALFVIHQIEKVPLLRERSMVSEAFSLGDTLERATKYISQGRVNVLDPRTLGYDVGGLLRIVRRAFDIENDDAITSNFFGGNKQLHNVERDVSYYVMYRYATRRDMVIKSFLAILSPKVNNFGCYSFTHVYGGSITDEGTPPKGSKRISRGVVMSFQHSTYFVSGAGLITEGSKAPQNQGFEAFAVPHTIFVPDYRLLTGTQLSNSLAWRPVVARFALVHLGFQGKITDETVKIRFMPRTALKEDIKEVCARCDLTEKDFPTDPVKYVEEKINNCPKVDRSKKLSKKLAAEGILRAISVEDGHEPPS